MKKGFSALVTWVILMAALIAYLTVRGTVPEKAARMRHTLESLFTIREVLHSYCVRVGKYPASLGVVFTNDSAMPKDGFGRRFWYLVFNNGAHYSLTSAGPDGRFGTLDDMSHAVSNRCP